MNHEEEHKLIMDSMERTLQNQVEFHKGILNLMKRVKVLEAELKEAKKYEEMWKV